MDEKKAFGRGLRQLRLIRGLSQEAFTPVLSLTYVSVIERGAKLIALDRIGGLAAALDLHPLTLLTAMYVEKDGAEVDELLTRVQADFANLAAQPPSQSVGKDSRNRAEALAEAMQWLEGCQPGRAGAVKKSARRTGSRKKSSPD